MVVTLSPDQETVNAVFDCLYTSVNFLPHCWKRIHQVASMHVDTGAANNLSSELISRKTNSTTHRPSAININHNRMRPLGNVSSRSEYEDRRMDIGQFVVVEEGPTAIWELRVYDQVQVVTEQTKPAYADSDDNKTIITAYPEVFLGELGGFSGQLHLEIYFKVRKVQSVISKIPLGYKKLL